MKPFITIGILFILLSGCTQHHDKSAPVLPEKEMETMVIDHPAAIVLRNPNNDDETVWNNAKLNAKKILSPFKIPLIPKADDNLEFVKNNGNKVRLNIGKLSDNYQFILFNAVNDPLLCNFSELEAAALKYFDRTHPFDSKRQSLPGFQNLTLAFPPDTLPSNPEKQNIALQERKPKKIILYQSGPDGQNWKPRTVPGIEYVISKIDPQKKLEVTFENDLITFANTDRYFTNGITFKYQSPRLSSLRLSKLMLPYNHAAVSKSSIILVQNMYTPTDTRYAPALKDDRPYASYLYLGYRRSSKDKIRMLEFSTEFILGFTGPYSPGSYFQTLVHQTFPTNDRPLGWETQIQSDPIINYSVSAEKTLLLKEHFLMSANLEAKLGSLYTHTSAGFKIVAGKDISPFSTGHFPKKNKWHYSWYLKSAAMLVGYDATLQGGLLNRDNIFTLHPDEISRWVASAETGVKISYKDTGVEVAQHFLSPEYKSGMLHKWGRISLLFNL